MNFNKIADTSFKIFIQLLKGIMKYFKTHFPVCLILNHLYFVLGFFICQTPQWELYGRCDVERECHAIFKVFRFVLCISLLKACVRYFFFQIFISSPNDSPLKTMRMFFISSKKLFSFSRYFFDFFPSFLHFPDSKEQMEVE